MFAVFHQKESVYMIKKANRLFCISLFSNFIWRSVLFSMLHINTMNTFLGYYDYVTYSKLHHAGRPIHCASLPDQMQLFAN